MLRRLLRVPRFGFGSARCLALTLGLAGLGLAASAQPALADTITFKNGHEVHGRLIEETDKYVVFQVGNGKLKFDKKEIATFTEDADYGQRYFTPPKKQGEPDNFTPGTDGKAGRTFFVGADATPEEKKDLKAVHARIDEELAKLGASSQDRARKLDLTGDERAALDAAVAKLGKGKAASSEFGAFGVKAIPALADALQGDSATKADAAAGIDEAVRRGDEGDTKWALGKYRIATLLAAVLDSAGDDASAQARNAANHALETISSRSQGWTDTKDAAPTDSQRAAATKWKDWAKEQDAAWETAEKEREGARATLNKDWRDLDDTKNWRKALAHAVDTYGTTLTKKGDTDTTKPKDGTDDKTNPEIAKAATPEQLKAISEARDKIKKTLDSIVGLSVEDRKKKYAPSSDELQDMQQSLHNMGDAKRRGGAELRRNAIDEIVSKYGLKALAALNEALDGDNLIAKRGAATAVGGIVNGDSKEDAQILVRDAGIPPKLVGMLDDVSDQRSPGIRLEANKSLEAISGQSLGWPANVTDQNLTPEESEAKKGWADWATKDAADFRRVEKLREEHRKTLTELMKKLDLPRGWKDALDAAPAACAKAEKDLKK